MEHKATASDQILEMYLNRVYFWSGAYGVEAASRRYFGKSARDVIMVRRLAGLLKAPSGCRRRAIRHGPRSARSLCCCHARRGQDQRHGIDDGDERAAMQAPSY
jgi:penicillin-binding protein 1A